jgi:septal ring factor EnvC (AmiA/AmiB activator)
MKTEVVKGMRDIPTIQGLRHRSVPTTREQAVTELARLEHEKARLGRELNIWVSNQQKTESRLRQVEERLALLEQILNPPAAEDTAKRTAARRLSPQEADSGEGAAQGWREIPLEY